LSKHIAIEPGLLELLQKVAGSGFFETQCTYVAALTCVLNAALKNSHCIVM